MWAFWMRTCCADVCSSTVQSSNLFFAWWTLPTPSVLCRRTMLLLSQNRRGNTDCNISVLMQHHTATELWNSQKLCCSAWILHWRCCWVSAFHCSVSLTGKLCPGMLVLNIDMYEEKLKTVTQNSFSSWIILFSIWLHSSLLLKVFSPGFIWAMCPGHSHLFGGFHLQPELYQEPLSYCQAGGGAICHQPSCTASNSAILWNDGEPSAVHQTAGACPNEVLHRCVLLAKCLLNSSNEWDLGWILEE